MELQAPAFVFDDTAALRDEVQELEVAMECLAAALDSVERDRDREADDALEARARLGAARELHAELRRALTRVELLAEIRGRLLADIAAAQPWRRGAAIRRAQRVEQLITSH